MGSLREALDSGRVAVVADIGQAHGGSIEHAEDLLYRAAWAGVDCVKSQRRIQSPSHWSEMDYGGLFAFGPTYAEHRERLELSTAQHQHLARQARTLGVEYVCSPFDLDAMAERALLDPWIKLPSAFLSDEEMVTRGAAAGKPVVLSTGGHEDAHLYDALRWCDEYGAREVYALHTVSGYPCKAMDYDVSWLAAWSRQERRPLRGVGISLHCDPERWDDLVALVGAAVSHGARIVEAHITLDRNARGRDHACSLLPEEMRRLVAVTRSAQAFTGDGVKRVRECEREPMERLKRMRGAA